MLLTTRRWIIFWDIPTGKCDQRNNRSTRKGMFYRPDWVKAASGANIAIAKSSSKNLMAVGSEDGYMFVYEHESGMPVCMKGPATKHQAPVSFLLFCFIESLPPSVYIFSIYFITFLHSCLLPFYFIFSKRGLRA
jgi:hypothetical protein